MLKRCPDQNRYKGHIRIFRNLNFQFFAKRENDSKGNYFLHELLVGTKHGSTFLFNRPPTPKVTKLSRHSNVSWHTFTPIRDIFS